VAPSRRLPEPRLRPPGRREASRRQDPERPHVYRLYELASVYGNTLKHLIHEEFGDGIMSAIDFRMHLDREPDRKAIA